ncbi:MAG: hypothetical protein WBL99_12565 [Candidatus Acidiferrales bacterium]
MVKKVSHKIPPQSTAEKVNPTVPAPALVAESGRVPGARFRLGQDVRDRKQGGKIVTIGTIRYNDDPRNRDFRYGLGCTWIVRRERDLEPL